MTTFATLADLLEVDPSIQDYGVLDFEAELSKAQDDVVRLLKVRWWPMYSSRARTLDIAIVGAGPILDETKLDSTQWTKATVFKALADHIGPKLSKFEEVPDRFRNQMDYYAQRFEVEFDLCVREGVRYQIDNDPAFNEAESASDTTLRLRR